MDLRNNIIEKEKATLFQTYKRLPIVVDRAKANLIWDMNGKCYYDFLSGIAVNVLGHNHPLIIEAAKAQFSKFMHLSNYFYQDIQIRFAEKLKQMAGLDKVFLSNSGTEANESAIKLCRRWGYDKSKTEIIAFSGGFHGRTYGSLSLMDKPNYKDKMGPWLENMKIVNYNDCNELREVVNEKTAGIIFECIQGEGGLVSISPEMVTTIDELRKKFEFLIIADEVQTGAGRTGYFLACELFGIKPDIVTMAKSIGGGLPLGAMLATEALSNTWIAGNHGTTFGGNAVACATGLVVLKELEREILSNTKATGEYFKKVLIEVQNKFSDKIIEIRGHGLMLGIVLNFDATILVQALLDKQIIANATSNNVLRILPPLIIQKSDVDIFIDRLTAIMANL